MHHIFLFFTWTDAVVSPRKYPWCCYQVLLSLQPYAFGIGTTRLMTNHLVTIQGYDGPPPKKTRTYDSDLKFQSSLSHMLVFGLLSNQLAFTAICNSLWSHDHDFCHFCVCVCACQKLAYTSSFQKEKKTPITNKGFSCALRLMTVAFVLWPAPSLNNHHHKKKVIKLGQSHNESLNDLMIYRHNSRLDYGPKSKAVSLKIYKR